MSLDILVSRDMFAKYGRHMPLPDFCAHSRAQSYSWAGSGPGGAKVKHPLTTKQQWWGITPCCHCCHTWVAMVAQLA